MADERLVDFPAKTTPVAADIIYLGDSADSYLEKKSTISEIITGYSASLASMAGVATVADRMLYTTGVNTWAATAITAAARTVLDDASTSAMLTTLGALPLAGGTMLAALILSTSSPATALEAASKGYVDAVASGRQIKDPCAAATTGALTANYSNGTSGLGATLTNAGAMAAFSVDGYSAALNDRILVKDQASNVQNGIYTVTTVGSGAANWVLTRATDMDLAAEFKGATTFITGGSTLAGQTYTETATVVTVGTDPVTFVLTGDSTGVTSVATGAGLTGGTITSTGTIALEAVADNTLMGNSSGGSLAPSAQSVNSNTFAFLATPSSANLRALLSDELTPTNGLALFGLAYATGTPTVTLVGGAGNTVPVYSVNSMRWTQHGKTVFCDISLSGDGGAEGAGTGVLNIALPVAAGASMLGSAIGSGRMINGANTYILNGNISASGTTISLRVWSAITTLDLATGDLQNNASREITLHLVYEVD